MDDSEKAEESVFEIEDYTTQDRFTHAIIDYRTRLYTIEVNQSRVIWKISFRRLKTKLWPGN